MWYLGYKSHAPRRHPKEGVDEKRDSESFTSVHVAVTFQKFGGKFEVEETGNKKTGQKKKHYFGEECTTIQVKLR